MLTVHYRVVVGGALAIACATASAFTPPVRAESAVPSALPSQLRPYEGVWVRAEQERDDAARDDAIKRCTEGMFFGLRGIARTALRRQIRPPGRYVMTIEGDSLWVAADEKDPRLLMDFGVSAGPSAGKSNPLSNKESNQESSRFRGGKLVQTWQYGENAKGSTAWRVSEDGGRLEVDSIVNDRRLGDLLEYTTTYRRRAAPEGGVSSR